MSLYCDSGYDYDDVVWWWYQPADEAPLATKRSRKCCSCKKKKISVGDVARKVQRFRPPTGFEEERGIAYDEVQLADWYLCETCGDLSDALREVGFCYSLGDQSLKKQIREYREEGGVL